jgi:hypothetical protein
MKKSVRLLPEASWRRNLQNRELHPKNWKHRPFYFFTGIHTDVELVPVHAHAGFVFRRVLNGLDAPERGARGGGDGGDFGRVAEVGGSEAEA